MKPYEVEIFDRNFNFRYNALIDESGFSYKYDALSIEKNNVTLLDDITVRKSANSGTAGDRTICLSDYIRIMGKNIEVSGIIIKIEKKDNTTVITYSDLSMLFDHEVMINTEDITKTYIEDYLRKLLLQEFSTTSDTTQRIYGLSVTASTHTPGTFDWYNTNDVKSIINLYNDYIQPAFRNYLVLTKITLNIPSKTVSVDIRKADSSSVKVIEGSLKNVVADNYTLRQDGDEINKVTLYDVKNDAYTRYNYYLHASDYSYSQTDSDRLVPVNNKVETFDTGVITEEGFWEEPNNALGIIQNLIQYNGDLSAAQMTSLQDAFTVIFPYFKVGFQQTISASGWFEDKADFKYNANGGSPYYPIFDDPGLNPTVSTEYFNCFAKYKALDDWYSDSALMTPDGDGNLFYTYKFNSKTTTISSSNLDFRTPIKGYEAGTPVIPPGSWGYAHTDEQPAEVVNVVTKRNGIFGLKGYGKSVGYEDSGQGVIWLPTKNTNYSHLHVLLPYEIMAKGGQRSESSTPGQAYEYYVSSAVNISGYLNIAIAYSDLTSAINAYKSSAQYQADYAAYRARMTNQLIDAYVTKQFATTKFKNVIELSFIASDTMVNPLTMNISQIVEIIKDGKSYNSVLTGREIKSGLVKLIFGMIRLDLTKILNMKGV